MTICNQRFGLKLGGRIIFSLLYFRKPKYMDPHSWSKRLSHIP